MKQRIEFYQLGLRPAPNRPSLVWGLSGVLLIGLLWGGVFGMTAWDNDNTVALQQQLQQDADAELANLEQLQRKVSQLTRSLNNDERERLERDIREQQLLLELLSSDSLISYAGVLTDLASVPWQDVSLQGLSLEEGTMTLRGYARDAQAVPAWFLGFKQTDSLSGRDFGKLEIRQDQDNLLFFSLHSAQQAKQ